MPIAASWAIGPTATLFADSECLGPMETVSLARAQVTGKVSFEPNPPGRSSL